MLAGYSAASTQHSCVMEEQTVWMGRMKNTVVDINICSHKVIFLINLFFLIDNQTSDTSFKHKSNVGCPSHMLNSYNILQHKREHGVFSVSILPVDDVFRDVYSRKNKLMNIYVC